MRFDPFHQHAAEDIAPTIVIGDTDAGRQCRTRQSLPIRLPSPERRQEIDAGKARERISHAEPRGRGEWVGRAAAKGKLPRAGRLRCLHQNDGAVAHQRFVALAGPIPFDQREFRRV